MSIQQNTIDLRSALSVANENLAKANTLPDANSNELKIATGHINSLASAVTISGLGFTPKQVFLQTASNGRIEVYSQYSRVLVKQTGLYDFHSRLYSTVSDNYIYSTTSNSSPTLTITSDGFEIQALGSNYHDNPYVYVAIGV